MLLAVASSLAGFCFEQFPHHYTYDHDDILNKLNTILSSAWTYQGNFRRQTQGTVTARATVTDSWRSKWQNAENLYRLVL